MRRPSVSTSVGRGVGKNAPPMPGVARRGPAKARVRGWARDDDFSLDPPRRGAAFGAFAEPCRRRSPCRADGASRGAWAPPSWVGRDFLAISAFHFGRTVVARRLAALGARRARLRARTGVGGRAHRLDLVRPLFFVTVPIEPRPGPPS